MSTTTAARAANAPMSVDLMEADARPWSRLAACAGRTTLFFSAPGEGAEARTVREAKAARLCAVCPVLAPCREWARSHREYGFWGGESEDERAAAGFRAHPPRAVRQRRLTNPDRVA